MARAKIPVLLFPLNTVRRLGKRLRGLGENLVKLQPKLGETLAKIEIEVEPEEYAAASFVSSFVYGLLFFAVAMAALLIRGAEQEPLYLSIMLGVAMWVVFYLLHMIYPAIELKKISVKESRDLLFALREMTMGVKSGVPLFSTVRNVGNADYGYVSQDFRWVTQQIESGVPEREALKLLAVKTESEYLKRAVWQLVNAMESGAGMGDALAGIVSSAEEYIYRDIKNYSSNLNFLMLIYMLVAVVVPSLGVTFLVLLSAFGDLGVTIESILMLIGISAAIQIAMIGYMSTTRPEVFGG